MPPIVHKRLLFEPEPSCPWGSQMVLNPALLPDPHDPDHLVMLFRATGPCPEKGIEGIDGAPFPISLGFAESFDAGENWQADWQTPAMAPRMEFRREKFIEQSFRDGRMFDYANANLEDPRLFFFEGRCYMTIACRPFPTGAYWARKPFHLPAWLRKEQELGEHSCLDAATRNNQTVTMLYRVDFDALRQRRYAETFELICPLHQTACDDRDIVLFPRRLRIDGREQIVQLHRPNDLSFYPEGRACRGLSIFLACADEIEEFHQGRAKEYLLAKPEFDWESERIGASAPPLELSPGRWLISYHGEKDRATGYTQSYLILEEQEHGIPRITARPSERFLYATEEWEFNREFQIPCLFTCGGVPMPDGRLLISYGASDKRVGLGSLSLHELCDWLEKSKLEGLH